MTCLTHSLRQMRRRRKKCRLNLFNASKVDSVHLRKVRCPFMARSQTPPAEVARPGAEFPKSIEKTSSTIGKGCIPQQNCVVEA